MVAPLYLPVAHNIYTQTQLKIFSCKDEQRTFHHSGNASGNPARFSVKSGLNQFCASATSLNQTKGCADHITNPFGKQPDRHESFLPIQLIPKGILKQRLCHHSSSDLDRRVHLIPFEFRSVFV